MQLVRLTVGGGDRSVPLARCKQGVVAHGRHQVIKADGRFVIVSAWKNRADVLDPSHSIRVHVNADCRVAFLAYEEMPSRKGGPVIGHVHCVHDGDEPRQAQASPAPETSAHFPRSRPWYRTQLLTTHPRTWCSTPAKTTAGTCGSRSPARFSKSGSWFRATSMARRWLGGGDKLRFSNRADRP